VYAALAKFGAPVEGLSAKDFAEHDNFFRMGTPPTDPAKPATPCLRAARVLKHRRRTLARRR
jgi:hypothetical protein